MVSSGLSQVSQSLTHSGGGIMWLEPAAGAIPELSDVSVSLLGSQCGSPCSQHSAGPAEFLRAL